MWSIHRILFLPWCFAFWDKEKVVSDTGGAITASKWSVLPQNFVCSSLRSLCSSIVFLAKHCSFYRKSIVFQAEKPFHLTCPPLSEGGMRIMLCFYILYHKQSILWLVINEHASQAGCMQTLRGGKVALNNGVRRGKGGTRLRPKDSYKIRLAPSPLWTNMA